MIATTGWLLLHVIKCLVPFCESFKSFSKAGIWLKSIISFKRLPLNDLVDSIPYYKESSVVQAAMDKVVNYMNEKHPPNEKKKTRGNSQAVTKGKSAPAKKQGNKKREGMEL